MNKYELALILPGETSSAKQKSIADKLEKVVTLLKGKLGKVEDFGKIELEYKIKKQEAGVFLVYRLELEADNVKALDDKLRMEGDILRYLLIRK